MRQHLNLPPTVIGALLGAHGTTISHATSLTATLLARWPPPPAAPSPGIRLRTLADLREYAADHGITIPVGIGGHTSPADSTLQAPDTPQTQLNLEYSPGSNDVPSWSLRPLAGPRFRGAGRARGSHGACGKAVAAAGRGRRHDLGGSTDWPGTSCATAFIEPLKIPEVAESRHRRRASRRGRKGSQWFRAISPGTSPRRRPPRRH